MTGVFGNPPSNAIMTSDARPLAGRVIALPETRLLDVLANLLEQRGARVLRCPMVAIHDSPNRDSVLAWQQRLIDARFDLFLIFTGEGLRRLVGFAERAGTRADFVEALAATRKLTRGPKPVRALRELGLKPELEAAAPTTDGVIETLDTLDLDNARVAVQLYGTDPNSKLIDYLARRRAEADCVAPYIYASAAEDERVAELIDRMRSGDVDAIAFTSKAQIARLRDVARRHGLERALGEGLDRVKTAAVGPVVADELRAAGVRVDAMPNRVYSMKPLVNEIAELWRR